MWCFSPPEQKRRAQHEQRVGDNRAGNGRLHQHDLPGAQCGERDDQLRQVPERRIEQATDRVAGLGGHGFCGMTQQRRQRHDRENREHEQQRMRLGLELLTREYHGHAHQQPQHGIAPNFVKQRLHECPSFITAQPAKSHHSACPYRLPPR